MDENDTFDKDEKTFDDEEIYTQEKCLAWQCPKRMHLEIRPGLVNQGEAPHHPRNLASKEALHVVPQNDNPLCRIVMLRLECLGLHDVHHAVAHAASEEVVKRDVPHLPRGRGV